MRATRIRIISTPCECKTDLDRRAPRPCTPTATRYLTELARRAPAAISRRSPALDPEYDRMPHSGLHALTTARLKEAISWPLKPGPMRD